MLIPLEEEEYKKLSNEAEFAKMLLAIEGKSFFLIKEQISSVIYHKVVHDQNMRIPVAISDRIIKNKDGEFEPVKAYEGFEISINWEYLMNATKTNTYDAAFEKKKFFMATMHNEKYRLFL